MGWKTPAAAIVATAAFFSAAGALTAYVWRSDEGPVGSVRARLVTEAVGQQVSSPAGSILGQFEPGDKAIDFPVELSDLPNPPTDIVADANGQVWFVIFQYDGMSNKLYRYEPAKDVASAFDIPSGTGSELHSAIAVDSRGHVLVGDGDSIVDFDPSSEGYHVTALPSSVARADPLPGYTGTFITDMAVGRDNQIYLSRMNVAAITEIDLQSGRTSEIAFPPSFRPVYDIALSGDDLWLTTWMDLVDQPSRTAILSVSTREFRAVPAKTSALAPAPDGVFGTSLNYPGLVNATRGRVSAIESAVIADSLQGMRDFITADPKTGAVWLTGDSRPTIARYEPGSALTRSYALPKYTSHIYSRGCTQENCPSVREIGTAVRGLAVAPNGDVYFSDATRNRIGVIRADR